MSDRQQHSRTGSGAHQIFCIPGSSLPRVAQQTEREADYSALRSNNYELQVTNITTG